MKISNYTNNTLKNFSTINKNFLARPQSNNLITANDTRTLVASVDVPDVIESDNSVILWDVTEFLSVINSMEEPNVTFKEKYLEVSNENSKVRLLYASEEAISKIPPNVEKLEGIFENSEVSFTLTSENLQKIVKFADILSRPDMRIFNKDGKIFMQAMSKEDRKGNTFDIEVGEYSGDKNFDCYVKRELLKFLPGNYVVTLSENKIGRFEQVNEWGKIQYFAAFDDETNWS